MKKYLNNLFGRLPELSFLEEKIVQAYELLQGTFQNDGVLYVCGNGGSAADSEHIVGELMKGFVLQRPIDAGFKQQLTADYGEEGEFIGANLQQGLRAVSLTGHPALSTAFGNDVESSMVFAQQLYVLGRRGDVAIGISTSGNSGNVLKCLQVAKAKGLKTIAMTGESGGKCAELVDCLLNVPETETYRVQEYHLPLYHTLCLMIEDYFYGEEE